MDLLNIKQLECFRAIMRTGNMTQAAQMLGIAQPSASSLITNLEHTLGFKLFERIKGRLIATPEAQILLADVARTLESVELTEHHARQIREDRKGDLAIVSYPDIAIDFLPDLLSKFLENRSGIRINLQARRTEMMSGLLPTHDYDLAITTRLRDTENLSVKEFPQPCVVIFPKGTAPDNIKMYGPEELSVHKLITVTSTHPTTVQLIDRFSQSGGIHPNIIIETQTFESVCSFVRRSAGVGIIDAITASRYTNEVDIRIFKPLIWNYIFLLRPLGRPSSQILNKFEELVSKELSKISQTKW
ncbi:MAG: LysR substrate-binding domain-containing protein [Paracoccaceae bacterium]|nr:LysR substrate-binding domain-containing protein [Paracoccaceae bacterium]